MIQMLIVIQIALIIGGTAFFIWQIRELIREFKDRNRY